MGRSPCHTTSLVVPRLEEAAAEVQQLTEDASMAVFRSSVYRPSSQLPKLQSEAGSVIASKQDEAALRLDVEKLGRATEEVKRLDLELQL